MLMFLLSTGLFLSSRTGDTGSCCQRWRELDLIWIKLSSLVTTCCPISLCSALRTAISMSHRSAALKLLVLHVYHNLLCRTHLCTAFLRHPSQTARSTPLQAITYTQTLASPLSSKLSASHPVGHFMRRRVELSPGANYSIVIPALNPEDVNSVVNILFQVPTSA